MTINDMIKAVDAKQGWLLSPNPTDEEVIAAYTQLFGEIAVTVAKPIKLLLYHASDSVKEIQDIHFPGPRNNCDFGSGFYLAESKQTAEEWVIRNPTPVINSYVCEVSENDILHLTGEDWIKVVVASRTRKIKVRFKSSIIKGLIADDRMDIALAAFMDGTFGDKRLFESLNYCNLGTQYLLRNSSGYLSEHKSKPLIGLELQRATDRWRERRHGMEGFVRGLFRKPVAEEKYIDDYIAGGDYIEP